MPKVSYIVNAFDRPKSLRMTLASIHVQADPSWECLVADNGGHWENHRIVDQMDDDRFAYVDTSLVNLGVLDCYWAAEWVVEHVATGDWLCFPSDDSYYMPVFQDTCLAIANKNGWELVYPEMLYDRRGSAENKYHMLGTHAANCQIDKTGFLLKRSRWIGFPDKPAQQGSSCCDGQMIDRLVASGISHGKVEECLIIHN